MSDDLQELETLSSALGADTSLVQGPGGNTSVKTADGTLWVKASGTWLSEAGRRAIFVPVRHREALAAIERGEENLPAEAIGAGGPEGLRPSVETTLHALMPHRVVAHTHAVNTIATAVRRDAESMLTEKLDGLAWAFVPYCRPGLPLTQQVAAVLAGSPADVLVLGNHGLVVGADDAEAASALTREVETRLSITPRRSAARGDGASPGAGWRRPCNGVNEAVAFDPQGLAVAVNGSLYPDHVVFLGHAIAVADRPDDMDAPACVVPGNGVFLRDDLVPAGDWMIHALSEVTTRLGETDPIRYLSPDEEAALINWDAEVYRQALARSSQPG